jgi:hypothetical protein
MFENNFLNQSSMTVCIFNLMQYVIESVVAMISVRKDVFSFIKKSAFYIDIERI